MIYGTTIIRENEFASYSAPFTSGDTFNWSVSSGGTIRSSSKDTNTVVVQWGSKGSETLEVNINSTTTTLNITVEEANHIEGPDIIAGGSISAYSIQSNGALSWSISGGQIISASDINSIVVLWDSVSGSHMGSISVIIDNDPPIVLNVCVKEVVISGSDLCCQNDVANYSVPFNSSANYQWSVYNGSIISSIEHNSVVILWSDLGNCSLQILDKNTGESFTIDVYVSERLAEGPLQINENEFISYSASFVSNIHYSWLLFGDGTIVSGANNHVVVIKCISSGYNILLWLDDTGIYKTIPIFVTSGVISGLTLVKENSLQAYSVSFDPNTQHTWTIPLSGSIASHAADNLHIIQWDNTINYGIVEITDNSDSRIDKVIKLLNSSISGPDAAISNEICTYFVAETFATTFQWDIFGGYVYQVLENAIKVIWDNTGNNIVMFTDQDGKVEILPVFVFDPQIEGAPSAFKDSEEDYSFYNLETGNTLSWYKVGSDGNINGPTQDVLNITIQWGQSSGWIEAIDDYNKATCLPVQLTDIPTPEISGNSSACGNGPEESYTTAYVEGDFYEWNVNGGEIVSSDKNNVVIQWTQWGVQQIRVTQSNDGGSVTSDGFSVTVKMVPAPNIIGSIKVSAGSTVTYVTKMNDNDFLWDVSGGLIMEGQGTNKIVVYWPPLEIANVFHVYVSESNDFCTPPLADCNLDISVMPIPNPVVTGDESVCENVISVYSTPDTGNNYDWTVKSGTIISGQGTHSIQVLWDFVNEKTKGWVEVNESNSVSIPPSRSNRLDIIIWQTPSPNIVGPELVSADQEYEYSTFDTGSSFEWVVIGGTIMSDQNPTGVYSSKIKIRWDNVNQESNGRIEVTESNNKFINDSTSSLDITIKAIPNPSFTIDEFICSSDMETYSVTSRGNTFLWSVQGGTIVNGIDSNSVTILWDDVFEKTLASLSVIESNAVSIPGSVLFSKEIFLVAEPNPIVHGSIELVQGSYGIYFTALTGNNFIWSLPSGGGTIVAGQGSNSICVLWNKFAVPYSVQVIETCLGCNSSATSNFNVTVYASATTTFQDTQKTIIRLREQRDAIEKQLINKKERLTYVDNLLNSLKRKDNANTTDWVGDQLISEKASLESDISYYQNAFNANNDFANSIYGILASFHEGNITTQEWDITTLISNLDDRLPIILFPVRLETKFKKSEDIYKIQVRIYPDDISIETHEESLTQGEIDAGKQYWNSIWINNFNQDEKIKAWTNLATTTSPFRAAWIVKVLTPINLLDLDQTGVNPKYPLPDKKSFSWTRQPEALTMPDQFITVIYFKAAQDNDYTKIMEVPGSFITDRLKVGIDPRNADSMKSVGPSNDKDIELGAGMGWLGDFTLAKTEGMAIEADITGVNGLSNSDIESGSFKVVAIGVKFSADISKGKKIVENLFDNHHYTDAGLEIIKINTHTSNTSGKDADFYTNNLPNSYFPIELNGPLFDITTDSKLKSDGQLFADLLGINPAVFQNVKNSDKKDAQNVRHINNALWASTFGYYLGDLWFESISQNDLEKTREFFTNHVSARGILPSLRIDNQMYGFLPTSNYGSWNWESNDQDFDFLTNMTRVGNLAYNIWKQKSYEVPYAHKPEQTVENKQQRFFDIMSLQPVSMDYYHRFAAGLDFLWNHYSLRDPEFTQGRAWYDNKMAEIIQTYSAMGFSIPTTMQTMHDFPKIMRLRLATDIQGRLIKSLVQNGELSDLEPLISLSTDVDNYIEWIASRTFNELKINNYGVSNPLYLLLKQALMLEYWRGAMQKYNAMKLTPIPNGWVDSEFINYVDFNLLNLHPGVHTNDIYVAGVDKWKVLDAYYSANVKFSQYLDSSSSNGQTERYYIDSVKNSLGFLKDLPSKTLDLLMREHFDLCSYRLDAWLTGMAVKRMREYRKPESSATNSGIYIGAYGWVEDLTVKERNYLPVGSVEGYSVPIEYPSGQLGFIHAPTMNHAVAGALLKSGYDAIKDNEWGNAWGYPRRISLTSERVRTVLTVFEGIRNGIELGIQLGYEFERSLRENMPDDYARFIDRILYVLKNRFPAKTVTTAPSVPDEEKSKYIDIDTVDGFKLYQVTRQELDLTFPYNLPLGFIPIYAESGLIIKEVLEKSLDRLAEIVDSIGDLSMAEAAFQLIQSKHEAGSSIMQLIQKGGDIPNEIGVIKTPDVNTILTQRLALIIGSDSNIGWPTELSIRAKAEPYLNNWYAKLLGRGDQIFCTVQYVKFPDNDDSTLESSSGFIWHDTSVTDLGLQPIDLVLLTANDYNNDESILSKLIRFYTRKKYQLPFDTEIIIDYQCFHNQNNNPASFFSFYDMLPLIKQIKKLIGQTRYLSPKDFMVQHEASYNSLSGGLDVNDLYKRVISSYNTLTDLKNKLHDYYNIVEQTNCHDEDIVHLRDFLLEMSFFGVFGTITDYAIEITEEARQDIANRAYTIESILIKNIKDITPKITALNNLSNTQENAPVIIDNLLEIAGMIFGKPFPVLPRFKLFNTDEITLAFANSDSILPANNPLIMEEWFQGLSKVKVNIGTLDLVNVLSETIIGTSSILKPVQLPYELNDFWYGVPNENGAPYDKNKFSITLQYFTDTTPNFSAWQVGLMIDEWTEVFPTKTQTTGIAFNYDKPNSKAPNCVLLAISPQISGNWEWNDLVQAVNTTIEMVKIRGVGPELIGDSAFGHVARSLITAFQPTGETITSYIENAFKS